MFDLIEHKIVISPSALNIPEFKDLWRRDKKRSKVDAFSELSYVYYMVDFKSEYRNYPESKREDKIKEAFCKATLGEKWKPDQKVINAIRKYSEMQQTASLRYLIAVEGQLDEITNFLNTGEPISDDNIKDRVAAMDKANKILLDLPKLKESVKKDISQTSKIRGGGDIGLYET